MFPRVADGLIIGLIQSGATAFAGGDMSSILKAFVYLMQEGLRLTLLSNESEMSLISGETKAELLSYFIELMIGLLMAFKAKKLADFFSRR